MPILNPPVFIDSKLHFPCTQRRGFLRNQHLANRGYATLYHHNTCPQWSSALMRTQLTALPRPSPTAEQ